MPEDNTLKILLVDPSSFVRRVLQQQLNKTVRNAEIHAVGSGAEALKLLNGKKIRFDLVTTSLVLSDMDGLELCRSIRKSKTNTYTPVIVVSGDGEKRIERDGFQSGVTEYFDKAQGPDSLVKYIKTFIERNSGHVGKVLYVEDSMTPAVVVIRMLEKHGLIVEHVMTAEEAIVKLDQACNGGDVEYDLVITDFTLSGRMTGGDILNRIRIGHKLTMQELPVLVITASSNQDRQVELFRAGANDYITKPAIEEILIARVKTQMMIKQTYEALKRQTRDLHLMTITDPLTGARNKRYLLDYGEEFLKDKTNQHVAVLLFDVDFFKKINDNLGHLTGDRVLEAMGKLLVNEYDSKGHIACRFGGEEFVVLLKNVDAKKAVAEAERIRIALSELVITVSETDPEVVTITASIGVASTDVLPGLGLSKLMAKADEALYGAKEGGRNRVYMNTPDGPVPARDDYPEGNGGPSR